MLRFASWPGCPPPGWRRSDIAAAWPMPARCAARGMPRGCRGCKPPGGIPFGGDMPCTPCCCVSPCCGGVLCCGTPCIPEGGMLGGSTPGGGKPGGGGIAGGSTPGGGRLGANIAGRCCGGCWKACCGG